MPPRGVTRKKTKRATSSVLVAEQQYLVDANSRGSSSSGASEERRSIVLTKSSQVAPSPISTGMIELSPTTTLPAKTLPQKRKVKVSRTQTFAEVLSEEKEVVKELVKTPIETEKWPIVSQCWDAFMLLCLFYTATWTPFEVSFVNTVGGSQLALNYVIDAAFIFDIILCFVIPFKTSNGTVINNPWDIAKHYLKGWFLLDAISSLPTEVVEMLLDVESVRVIRTLRLLRLVKMLRVVRASRMIKKWETKVDLRYSLLQLFGLLLSCLLLAHWGACGYRFVAFYEDIDIADSWIGANGIKNTASSEYIGALYWSLMTVTTVGYGDVSPQTDSERVFALCFMSLGAILYAYIVGSFCAVITSLDPAGNDFRATMDTLNDMMESHSLTPELRRTLREYFVYSSDQYTQLHRDKVVPAPTYTHVHIHFCTLRDVIARAIKWSATHNTQQCFILRVCMLTHTYTLFFSLMYVGK
jgi:hypothetical protein